jgi:FkbM family methyltransferase
MKIFARVLKSLKYRIIDRDYVPYFAKKSFQPLAINVLKLSIRLLGFNNHGPSAKSGEEFFLRRFLETNPELCIDVGANVGKYSEFILKNSSSRVLAFEPLPGAFERLQLLQKQFGSRFTIENLGCAKDSGELKLYFGSETSELASFSKEVNQIDYVGASNVNTISVRTTSLDDYF